MPIDLYYMPERTPCRVVLMAARHMDIELNLIHTDVRAGDNLSAEFLALNPQHTIPTIVDNGLVLWESRAIIQYLASKVNSELYPFDPKTRASVDRLLYFDLGTLYQSIMDYFFPIMYGKKPGNESEETHEKFKDAVTVLNGFLNGKPYVSGERLTIADLSILGSLTFAGIRMGYDFGEWPNVSQWLNRLKNELPYYDVLNEKPLEQYKASVNHKE